MNTNEYYNKIVEIIKSAEFAPIDEYSRSLNRFIAEIFKKLSSTNDIDYDCYNNKPFLSEIILQEDKSKGIFLFQTTKIKNDINSSSFSEAKSMKKGKKYIFYISKSFKDYETNYRLDFNKI